MATTATIFDIQRNSFVDGPGIRTAVFFKGCNLHCKWCHNPESQCVPQEMMRYRNKCTGCKTCVVVCPHGAMTDDLLRDPEKCRYCGECELFCPVGAIRICGAEWTVEALMKELRKDIPFYKQSGGGVTFSGGECLLWPDFVEELAAECKKEGISVAIDTAGHVAWETLERMLPLADWFLYDVKCLSPEKHREWVGASNERILENLKKLLRICPEKVWIRTPVIPGFNADESEIASIAAFLQEHGVPAKWELLPYHRLGEGKNGALGREEFTTEVPSVAQMDALKALIPPAAR